MADGHEWFKIEGTDLMETVLAGVFLPQGVSAPTILSPTEGAWTVTRTGIGAYLVKFKNAVPRIMSVQCSVNTTTINISVQSGIVTQGTAIAGGTTIAIQAISGSSGLAFEIPALAQNMVSFIVTFSNDNSQSLKN